MLPGIIGGLVAGGVTSVTNLISSAQARKDAYNAQQRQMAFQDRMSSTAYQRAVADMKKAGLNPMLAYEQGGASSPSGAGADIIDVGEKAVATALDSMRLKQDIKESKTRSDLNYTTEQNKIMERFLMQEQGKLIRAQTSSAQATADAIDLQNQTERNRVKFEQRSPTLFGTWDALMKRLLPASNSAVSIMRR